MSIAKKTEQVVLIKPHTHGGKTYKTGDKIAVTSSQKAFLQQRNIIAPDETAPIAEMQGESVTENPTDTADTTAVEKPGKSAKAK